MVSSQYNSSFRKSWLFVMGQKMNFLAYAIHVTGEILLSPTSRDSHRALEMNLSLKREISSLSFQGKY